MDFGVVFFRRRATRFFAMVGLDHGRSHLRQVVRPATIAAAFTVNIVRTSKAAHFNSVDPMPWIIERDNLRSLNAQSQDSTLTSPPAESSLVSIAREYRARPSFTLGSCACNADDAISALS